MRGSTKYVIDEWDLKEFDEDEFLEDIDDSTLIKECERRNLILIKYDSVEISELQGLSKMKLHDFIADLVGVPHTCDNDTILNELKMML